MLINLIYLIIETVLLHTKFSMRKSLLLDRINLKGGK